MDGRKWLELAIMPIASVLVQVFGENCACGSMEAYSIGPCTRKMDIQLELETNYRLLAKLKCDVLQLD